MAVATKPSSMRKIESYFETPPVPKKRGRPTKKTRGRPPQEEKKQTPATPAKKQSMVSKKDAVIDLTLTTKQSDALEASLEGAVAKTNRNKAHRINWDTPHNSKLRRRIADSWLNKNDLYSNNKWRFGRFCLRTGIDRNVLQRFLEKLTQGNKVSQQKRGRKALLSESVMRHICEGRFLVCYEL